jgi:hypothetical protein
MAALLTETVERALAINAASAQRRGDAGAAHPTELAILHFERAPDA